MKTVLSAVVAAVLGFTAVYAFVSSQSEARLKQERAAFAAEKASLQAALAAAQNKPTEFKTVEVPVPAAAQPVLPAKLTPQQILDLLVKIHPGPGGNRAHDIRMVIYYLQMLVEDGSASLPPIHDFFAKNVDVDYSVEDTTGGTNNANNVFSRGFGRGGGGGGGGGGGARGFAFGFRRGQQLRMDFVLPPSMRLGLVDVVRAIGGADAEKILAGILSTTGRGVEVAYLAHTLEAMAPGKYRDLAISSAKELLMNLPTIDDPNRYDENAKGYLYGVLEMYNDISFVSQAQAQLIGSDGRIDRDALTYINDVLKDQSVATLYAAYKDQRLTNQFERVALASTVLNYAGQNPQANALFGEIVNNNDLNPGMRAMAIMRLAGGGGPFGGDSPTDPQLINARLQLLANMKSSMTDDRLSQALDTTMLNLQHLLNGEPLEAPNFGRGFFGGGGGGGGRRQQQNQQNQGQ